MQSQSAGQPEPLESAAVLILGSQLCLPPLSSAPFRCPCSGGHNGSCGQAVSAPRFLPPLPLPMPPVSQSCRRRCLGVLHSCPAFLQPPPGFWLRHLWSGGHGPVLACQQSHLAPVTLPKRQPQLVPAPPHYHHLPEGALHAIALFGPHLTVAWGSGLLGSGHMQPLPPGKPSPTFTWAILNP